MRLLILEDSETDQVLMQAAIARYATSCSVTFVSKLGDVEQYVDGADVVVVDLMLEDSVLTGGCATLSGTPRRR